MKIKEKDSLKKSETDRIKTDFTNKKLKKHSH